MKVHNLIPVLLISNFAFAQGNVFDVQFSEYQRSKTSLDLRSYELIIQNGEGKEENKFSLVTVAGQETAKKISNTANYIANCTSQRSETALIEIDAYTMKIATQQNSNVVGISWLVKKLANVEKVKVGGCDIDKVEVKEFSGNIETVLEIGDELKIQKSDNYQILIRRIN